MGDDRTVLTRRRVLAGSGLLVVGGAGAWTFRPTPVSESEGWEQRARLPSSRGEMKGAVLDDLLYVPGGLTGLGDSTDRMDVYDPETDQWESAASLPAPLNHHATATLDGVLYVVGGNRDFDDPPEDHVFTHDPDADEWRAIDAEPSARSGTAGAVVDGRFHLGGGENQSTVTGWTTDTYEVYDPTREEWIDAPDVPLPCTDRRRSPTTVCST